MLNLFKIFGENVKNVESCIQSEMGMANNRQQSKIRKSTCLPFPSLTVYKIKKNLENVPRNLDDLKYRGTFSLYLYIMLYF